MRVRVGVSEPLRLQQIPAQEQKGCSRYNGRAVAEPEVEPDDLVSGQGGRGETAPTAVNELCAEERLHRCWREILYEILESLTQGLDFSDLALQLIRSVLCLSGRWACSSPGDDGTTFGSTASLVGHTRLGWDD